MNEKSVALMTEYECQLARAIGRICMEWRKKQDLTKLEIAEMLGVSVNFVRTIETGSVDMTLAGIARAASVMGMTVNRLVSAARRSVAGSIIEQRYVQGAIRRRKACQRDKDRERLAAIARVGAVERRERKKRRREILRRKTIAGRKITPREIIFTHGAWVVNVANSIANTHPWTVAYWDKKGNGKLDPGDVTAMSGVIASWRCAKDGTHRFKVPINAFCESNGECPLCAEELAWTRISLAGLYPELAKEYDQADNGCSAQDIVVREVRSRQCFWWTCVTCGWHWSERLKTRLAGSLCPNCGHMAATA